VPPPAADAVEIEFRCDDEALSILGILFMEKRGEDAPGKALLRMNNRRMKATEERIMIKVELLMDNESGGQGNER
tara:strand:+ start:52305 stop:52529 length:225 start_codon:yes stop_codon:yes gene_type:complete